MRPYESLMVILREFEARVKGIVAALSSKPRYQETPREDGSSRAATIERLISAALWRFALGDFIEVDRLCRRALAIERGNTIAMEILEIVGYRKLEAEVLYQSIDDNADDADLGRLWDLLIAARAMYPRHPMDRWIGAWVTERRERFDWEIEQGFACIRKGEVRQALEAFRRAYELNPCYADLSDIRRELEHKVCR